jgi:hypothetical protein
MILSYASNLSVIYDHKTFIAQATGADLIKLITRITNRTAQLQEGNI